MKINRAIESPRDISRKYISREWQRHCTAKAVIMCCKFRGQSCHSDLFGHDPTAASGQPAGLYILRANVD